MTVQLLDTTTGAGDNLQLGGNKINRNTAQIAQRLGKLTPVYPIFDGDSKYGEIEQGLRWLAAFEGLELVFPATNTGLGIGGTTTANDANNLTSPARLANIASALAAHTTAGHVVDYYLTIGTNNTTANITPQKTMADVRKLHEGTLRAAPCVRYLVLVAIDPRASTDGNTATYIHTINKLYARYAELNPFDVIFIDTHSLLLDPAIGNANGNPVPFATLQAPMPLGAVTADGLHCGWFGMYMKRFAALPLRSIYKTKPSRNLSRANMNNDVKSANSNMLGANGRATAMGGTQGITNNGSGSITGTPPLDFSSNGQINGTVGIAFSASTVTVTTDGGIIPRGVWPAVRISFTGTPGAGENRVSLQALGNPSDGAILTGDIVVAGTVLNFNALTNALGVSVSSNNSSINTDGLGTTSTTALADALNQPLNGPIILEGAKRPAASDAGAFYYNLNFYLTPNAPLSGSVDIVSMYAERIPSIPAASA